MTQREVRKILFEILFEKELMKDIDVNQRLEEVTKEYKLSISKVTFLREYLNDIIENEDELIAKIREKLKGWSFETLGTVEKIILKISFYEILIKNIGYQIVINEALVLSHEYGDVKSKDFINGVLAELVD